MIIQEGSGVGDLGLSFKTLFKKPEVTAGAGLLVGAAAGFIGAKYGGQIASSTGSALKNIVQKPVDWYNQYRSAEIARREVERAQYGGHQISWWTDRGLRPGDTVGLQRYREAQARAAAGKSAKVASWDLSKLFTSTAPSPTPPGAIVVSDQAAPTSGIPVGPDGMTTRVAYNPTGINPAVWMDPGSPISIIPPPQEPQGGGLLSGRNGLLLAGAAVAGVYLLSRKRSRKAG